MVVSILKTHPMTIRTLIKALKSLFKAGILRDTRVQTLVNQRKLTLSKNHRTLVGALQLNKFDGYNDPLNSTPLCVSEVAIALGNIIGTRHYIRGETSNGRTWFTLPLTEEKLLLDIFAVVEYCQKPSKTKIVKVSKKVTDAIRLLFAPNPYYKTYQVPSELLKNLPALDKETLRQVVLYDHKDGGVRLGAVRASVSQLVDFKHCGGHKAYCIRSSEPDRVLQLPYVPAITPLFNAIVEVARVL